MNNAAQLAAGDVVACRGRIRAAPILETHLHDAAILACRLDHLTPLPNRIAGVLLHIHVLARLTGHDGGQGMPVFGRRNDHGIHLAVLEGHPHVGDSLGRPLLDPSQILHDAVATILPNIADILELHPGQTGHPG